MAIKVGDRVPNATFMVMTGEGPKPKTTDELLKGKKVVLFAVPGAFTPTCSNNHLPGFLENAATIKAKGVDLIAVVAVNDVHVMSAWEAANHNAGRILFLSDGSAVFAKAVGMDADMSAGGMGLRSRRYSLIVDDGVVQTLNIEEGSGRAEISGAARILEQLSR